MGKVPKSVKAGRIIPKPPKPSRPPKPTARQRERITAPAPARQSDVIGERGWRRIERPDGTVEVTTWGVERVLIVESAVHDSLDSEYADRLARED